MPDAAQLPYLLRLLDDDTPDVREAVVQTLTAFGPQLPEALARATGPDGRELVQRALDLAAMRNREWLKESWTSWFGIDGEHEKLEAALDLLAGFLSGYASAGHLGPALDRLAAAFRAAWPEGDAGDLAHYLFRTRKLDGARHDYYNPQNSNLLFVLVHKRGLPISLACVYILVAKRVGLRVEGCNAPGHFLALAFLRGHWRLVDCFNGGVFLDEQELVELGGGEEGASRRMARLQCDAPVMMTRTLVNLLHAYRTFQAADARAAADMEANRLLILDLVDRMRQSEEKFPEDEASGD